MKRVLAVISTITAALTLSAPAMAVFESRKINTVPASATVGGISTASFNMSLVKVANLNQTSTSIGWTSPQNTDGWKIADDMMRLEYNVTDVDGGVRIYTDNTAADANPRFVDPTPDVTFNLDSNPAGLVLTSNPNVTIPMAWSIKDSTRTIGTELAAADPQAGPETGIGSKFQWLFMLDRSKPAIDTNGDGDQTDVGEPAFIYDQPIRFSDLANVQGIHFGQANGDFVNDPDKISFVYFEANFAVAGVGGTYATNKITVEAYTQ